MLETALKKRQLLIFVLGWIAYASTYLLRKPLGVIKSDLETDLHFSKTELGWLDTALLFPYAVMQMLLGPLGDKFGARRTFSCCLVLSGLSMILFGWTDGFYGMFVLLFLNGTAQAQCWPNCMKSLGAWYPDSVRNTVFGMFGTCAFAGGIGGTALAVYLQKVDGWKSVYFTPSVIIIGVGIFVWALYQQPDEVGIDVPGKERNATSSKTAGKLTWLQMLKIPMLPEIAVSMFCLKVVRYCMYMWLPMYLLQRLKYTPAVSGMLSTVFEVGGVLGSAVIGFLIDKFFKGRTIFGTGVSVLLSAVSLTLFLLTCDWGWMFNVSFMFLAGAFNCGPDSLLGGAVPAELGEQDGKNAAASTVGLVNGFGSFGTCLEGPIIGFISAQYGWSGMFYMMIGLSFVGTASVFKAAAIHKNKSGRIPEAIPLNMDEV
ncbi:uncharacterized protein LOC127702356 [Mytilus californianus]|uniref:uncharacterized protein LOC127702356 n=1 Tax=Mytilus californianus TaxID=6549 RepID=UPI0022473627|nr:uncharacterized protein LOC127702356 [Mytilus californianus]